MRHVTNRNASCHTCECTMSHIACQYVRKRAVCLNKRALHLHKLNIIEPTKEACHTNERDIPHCKWNMVHVWMRYLTHVNEHLWISPVVHINEWRHTYKVHRMNETCLMWMSRISYKSLDPSTHINEWSHTYKICRTYRYQQCIAVCVALCCSVLKFVLRAKCTTHTDESSSRMLTRVVIGHIQTSPVTHIDASPYTCQHVTSHLQTSHALDTYESRPVYKYVTFPIWMCLWHVTRINASLHAYENVTWHVKISHTPHESRAT